MKKVRLFGSGIRGQIVADLIHWQFSKRFVVDGFYDDHYPNIKVGPGGHPVLGTVTDGIAQLSRAKDRSAFVGLGTKASARSCEVFLELRSRGVEIISLVSPTAHVSPSAKIGLNALIFPGAYVGSQVHIGDLVCVHAGTAIEHHSRIGHNVLLGPGCALSGYARIDNHAFLGAGCKIIPLARVGTGSFLGAGSVVVDDVPAHVVAYGVPAVKKRAVQAGDEVPTRVAIDRLTKLGMETLP